MKKIVLLFLVLCASSLLADEYVRSIRVASFYTQERAINAIDSIKVLQMDFSNCEENIHYRVRKIGIYYVLLVEPFTNKLLLQGSLDKIRTLYKDAYVTRYKRDDATLPFKMPKLEKTQEKVDKTASNIKPKVVIKEVEKIKTLTKVVVKKEYIESYYKSLFFILLGLSLLTLLYVLLKKRKVAAIQEETQSTALQKESDVIEQESIEDEFDDDLDLDLDEDIDFEDSLDALDLLSQTRDTLHDLQSAKEGVGVTKIEELVEASQESIRKIQEYSTQNQEKELLEEILLLRSLSESLALYLDTIAVENMKSERVAKEVEKIKLLLDDLFSQSKSS